MIRKLRRKVIAMATGSVCGVLFLILGIINILNYSGVVNDADVILEILAENEGQFPDIPDQEEPGGSVRGASEPEGTDPAETSGGMGLFSQNPSLSPEIPFESRYFSVLLDEDETVVETDVGQIAAVTADEAQEYALKALKNSKEKGFQSDYRYIKVEEEENTRVIFLDCTGDLSTFRTFLFYSILVALAGLLAVLILVIFLSAGIVRPFAESYEKQKRFITDAGHEIKTPLTIIDADSAVLEMEYGENEWLQDIQKQTLRLKELTNDLIYLSRMEEDDGRISMIDFPISDVVSETAQSFQAIAVTQNKNFVCSIEPMLTYCGDEQRIRKLLSILLDNALKYSQPGGRISLALIKCGKNLCISVFNTAENVRQEDIAHIFDRFYRMDESRNSGTGGYGIGLSIAKAIVESHKGRISAESADGKSMRMNVTL